jgi:hypothetical protein
MRYLLILLFCLPLYGQWNSFDGVIRGNKDVIRQDTKTWALNTIDYEHHEIHDGSSFTIHYSNTCTNTGEMSLIAFKTPNTTTWFHIVFESSSTAGSYVAIYEVSDLDVDEGADVLVYNRDRNSSITSTVRTIDTLDTLNEVTTFNEAQAAGATLSVATEIYRFYLGAAAAGADQSGQARATSEFILKQNTEYAFAVVSTSDDDNVHNIVLSWYEHANK